jgi:5,10-methylenetetrahydromethanopterin reductase
MAFATHQGGTAVLGPLEVAMSNAPTLGDAYRYCADHLRTYSLASELTLENERGRLLAARTAERITFAVGADPARVVWAIDLARKAAADAGRDPATLSLGLYVNVGCHPDLDTARSLISGGVAAFAHFSAMPGSTGAGLADGDKAVVAEVGRRYDSREHLRNTAAHTDALDADFVDRFAVVGPPDACVARLGELADLGIERFVVTSTTFGAGRDDARTAEQLLTAEILPALRDRDRTGTPDRGSP